MTGRGNVTSHVDRAGRVERIEWLPFGNPAAVVRDLNGTGVCVRTRYDQRLNTLRIEDELGRPVESYELDADGRVVAVTNLEGQVMAVHYTVGDRVAWVRRFDGTVVSNRYDTDGRLAETAYPDGAVTFGYLSNAR